MIGFKTHKNSPKLKDNAKGVNYTPSHSSIDSVARNWLEMAMYNAKSDYEKLTVSHIINLYDFAQYQITTKRIENDDL